MPTVKYTIGLYELFLSHFRPSFRVHFSSPLMLSNLPAFFDEMVEMTVDKGTFRRWLETIGHFFLRTGKIFDIFGKFR